MTAIRAFARRGLAKVPSCVRIPESDELAWLALRICRNDWVTAPSSAGHGHCISSESPDCQWSLLTGMMEPITEGGRPLRETASSASSSPKAKDIVTGLLSHVNRINQWSNHKFVLGFGKGTRPPQSVESKAAVHLIEAASYIPLRRAGEVASKLSSAIERVMVRFCRSWEHIDWKLDAPWLLPDVDGNWWRIDVQQRFGKASAWYIPTNSPHQGAESTTQSLTAGLSLWLYSLYCDRAELVEVQIQLFAETGASFSLEDSYYFARIIGNSDCSRLDELKQWIPGLTNGILDCQAIPRYGCQGYVTAHGGTPRWLGEGRTVFGMYHSASFR